MDDVDAGLEPLGGLTEVRSLGADVAVELLRDGELDIVGRLLDASNLNLFCTITRQCPEPEPDLVANCVYKPIRGERPLWDFPDGTLAAREVAAFVLSEAGGWGLVPPTVLRKDLRTRRRPQVRRRGDLGPCRISRTGGSDEPVTTAGGLPCHPGCRAVAGTRSVHFRRSS